MARLRQVIDDEARIHRVIVTVRSDFEPQVSGGDLKAAWNAGRCTVPPFSLEELKEVILMPTMQEVLIFDPPELVDEIVGDVVQSPGALPLLAYALERAVRGLSGQRPRGSRAAQDRLRAAGRRHGRAAQQGRRAVSGAGAGAAGDDAQDHAAHGLGRGRPGRPARADGRPRLLGRRESARAGRDRAARRRPPDREGRRTTSSRRTMRWCAPGRRCTSGFTRPAATR